MVSLLSMWWLLMGRGAQGFSSSGKLTPLSFQGFRSALKLRVDSIEIRDDFDTLLEPLKKLLLADCELFFLRSKKEEIEVMLPGFRSRSRILLRSRAMSAPNAVFTGESLARDDGACWRSLESKYCRDSSKESDFGRGIEPLTMVASTAAVANCANRKSIASRRPPALLRVNPQTSVAVGEPSSVSSSGFW